MDLDDVQSKITPRTKAIIYVHYSGRVGDMTALAEIMGDIPIIEDAAHAMGATHRQKMAGSFGTIGCFSFHAVKNLATGDGGALVTDSVAIYERAMKLRWLGINKSTWERASDGQKETTYSWQYNVDEIGYKYHMNDISAALAIVQLTKLTNNNLARAKRAGQYFHALNDVGEITLPPRDTESSKSSWHLFVIQTKKRNQLLEYLKLNGIASGVHYYPIHLYDVYGNAPSLPITERISDHILSLPMYPDMTRDEQAMVCQTIRSFFDTQK